MGAHFTPRAYVERVIGPAVIEPLREAVGRRESGGRLGRASRRERRKRGQTQTGGKGKGRCSRAAHGFLARLANDPRFRTPPAVAATSSTSRSRASKRSKARYAKAIGRAGGTGHARTPRRRRDAAPDARHREGCACGQRGRPRAVDRLPPVAPQTHGDTQPLPEPILKGYGQVEHRDALVAPDGTRRVAPRRLHRGQPAVRRQGRTDA